MKLIGLLGKKLSGKDLFFKIAFEYLSHAPDCMGYEQPMRMAFGDALKEECAAITGMGLAAIERDKLRFRTLLQWWGTDFRRNMFGFDYWIRRLQESPNWQHHQKLRARPGLNFITDVRFIDEARFVQDDGGLLVRIVRPATDGNDLHQSESELDTIKADFTITNGPSKLCFASDIASLMPALLSAQ